MIAQILAASALGGLAVRSRRRKNQRVKVFQGSFAPQTAFFGPGQSPRVQAFAGTGPIGSGSTAVPAGGDTGGMGGGGTDGHHHFRKFFFFQPWGWGWWPWWYNPYYQTSYATEYACLRSFWVHLTPIQPLPIKFPQKKSYVTPQSIGFVNIDAPTQRRVAMLWNDVTSKGGEVSLATAADIAFRIAGCSPNLSSRYDIDVVRSIRDVGLVTQ